MANGMPSMNNAGMGELFSRLRFVLVALIIYRIGTHIPVPGIDPAQLSALFDQNQGTILGLANVFSGGALERMSILALGILPYISASIIMQLMTAVTPELDAIKKEGESGRKKISQWTRYLTVALASATVRYRVHWLIFLRPDSPSFLIASNSGVTAVMSCIMIDAEM